MKEKIIDYEKLTRYLNENNLEIVDKSYTEEQIRSVIIQIIAFSSRTSSMDNDNHRFYKHFTHRVLGHFFTYQEVDCLLSLVEYTEEMYNIDKKTK